MPTDHIVALLIAERDKLNRAIAALQGGEKRPKAVGPEATITNAVPRRKRHVSAAARRKMALGQKKRWAAIKGAK